MAERSVPKLTFEQIKQNAKKPANISPEEWMIGLAVTETLLQLGTPTHVIKDSACGPDMPSRYKVGKIKVEHMPIWSYATVVSKDKGKPKREFVYFYDKPDATKEEIIVNLRETIESAAQS